MSSKVTWSAILVILVVSTAGCGGGGGPKQDSIGSSSYVITGTVKDSNTSAVVVGATVRIGSYQCVTNSSGEFTIEMPSAPDVYTYSIDGTQATPSPGYYDYWARTNNVAQSARCIILPAIQKGENSLGTIYLLNMVNYPQYPPSCPS
jgi:hypothetical protein